MYSIIFWIFIGMLIGWNLLPQPKWVKRFGVFIVWVYHKWIV